MAAIQRIDSVWDIQSIQAEYEQYLGFISDSKKALVDLYNTTKSFKDTSISNLADNTQQLSVVIGQAAAATNKAADANKNLTSTIVGVLKSTSTLNDTYTASAKSLEDNIKTQIRYKSELNDLKGKQAELASAIAVAGEATEDQKNRQVELIKATESVKQASTELQRTIRLQVKEQDAANGSIDELKANYDKLYQIYRKLSEADQQSEFGKSLNADLGALKKHINDLDISAGNFSGNVGNYSGAFKEAFGVLQTQLSATSKQMTDLEVKAQNVTGRGPIGFDKNRFKGDVTNFVKTGQGGEALGLTLEEAKAYDTAGQKAQVLGTNVERLSVGFKTNRQESRAFAEAASQVGLALGLESEEFQTFDKAIGHTQNAINDIKAATKFQSSDAKFIKGIADAATTLAGAFGAASAASALFAGEDEDLQKQMAKFQQLLVLINGLQAVANGLQAESGGIQLLLEAKTKLLNAAKAVQLLITTRAIQIVNAETLSTEANVISKEEDAAAAGEQVVAEEASTVAKVENTEATIANTAATTAAAGATKGLSTAFIAGGIAALAIGAGVALALLSAKLLGYGEQIGITVKQQKELYDAMRDLNDALNDQAKVFDDLDVSQRRYYSNLISDAQNAGASQYALLLAQERSDKAQADSAKAEVDRLGATDAAYAKTGAELQKLKDNQEEYANIILELNKIPEKDLTKAQKAQIKAAKDNIDLNKSAVSVVQDSFDRMKAARDALHNFTQKANEDETKFNKLSVDEQLSVVEKAEELRANLVKARNAIVLGDERTTLRQRVVALKSNVDQENAILAAQQAQIKNNPSNYINGLLTPEAQQKIDESNEKRKENILNGAEEIRKATKQVTDRQREERLTAFDEEQQAVIRESQRTQAGKNANYSLLTGAGTTSVETRSKAIADEAHAQRNILDAARAEELQKAYDDYADNQEKIKAINEKYANDIAKLQEDTQQKYFDLEAAALKESLAQWDKYYSQRKAQIDENQAEEIAALNERNLSDRKYSHERTKIDDNAVTARAQLAVQNAEIQRNATKEGTKERADADAALAKAGQDLSDQLKKNGDDRTKATIDDLQNIKEQSDTYATAIGDVYDIGYNRQEAHLEKLQAQQEKGYERSVKGIQDEQGSEEEKAVRLKILDSQHAAQEEAIARKRRQLDIQKAQFDKAKDILGIITGTALAVVKALPDIPLAISVGVLGGAELSAAVATPLPHYKLGAGIDGRPTHKGGRAVVGDDYRSEWIEQPGQPGYWSPNRPTVVDLAPYTKVIPPDRVNDYLGRSTLSVDSNGILRQESIKKDLQEVKDAIYWSTGRFEQAIKKNRPIVNNKTVVNTAWGNYINEKVFGKK